MAHAMALSIHKLIETEMSSQSSTQSWDGYGYPSFGPLVRKRARPSATARSALRKYGKRKAVAKRPSMRINGIMGVHRFIRNVNTNVASIISGTNGIINITSAISGGFRMDNVQASGPCMNWIFTLTFLQNNVFSTAGAIQTTTNYGVPSISEMIALFDNFRIDKIDVHMTFNKNQDALGPDGTGVKGFPEILMCVDQDDADYITIEQILQRENMQIWPLSQSVKTFSFVPKMNFLVSNQAGTAAVGVGTFGKGQPFLDAAASQNAPYFGVKMVMNNASGSTIGNDTVLGQLAINFKYHLSFKTVK